LKSNVFTGLIETDDFNTYAPNENRLSNISDSIHHKQECLKKKEFNTYKGLSLEELREMKIVSNTNGRPTAYLTDEKWQTEFIVRKMFILPHPISVKKLGGKYSKESGMWNDETQGQYSGTTNWQEYCAFMNDVLKNIQSGQIDYCYFIYQIMELAKFHLKDLRTKYCDGYWEVWLERKDG